jgi:hypothetical protein
MQPLPNVNGARGLIKHCSWRPGLPRLHWNSSPCMGEIFPPRSLPRDLPVDGR